MPSWVESLTSQLRCGMSSGQVQALTHLELIQVVSRRDLGTHTIQGERADLFLGFEEDRLVTTTSEVPTGLKGVWRTPKKNLCTGEIEFLLSVEWVFGLQGADVYLDDQLVVENASSGIIVKVPGGRHELRIEKDGYEPFSRILELGVEDQGDQKIQIEPKDLNPT